MAHPFWFVRGYRRLRVERAYAGELVSLCQRGGYVYRDFFFEGEYGYFFCSYAMADRLLVACRARGIPVSVERSFGLPALVFRYRRRWGILVGALLFVAILLGAGQVVWDVRVEGNETLEEREIVEQLRVCGMGVGDRIGALDTGVIENRMLIESDTISWISINMIGTVAQVEIREFVDAPEEETYAAANLVASRWGRIEYLEEVRGNVAVEIGDVVSEGDLLVGGLYDVEGGGIRYTRARGRVFARTERSFVEEIPLRYEKKVYTGEVKIEKYGIFFEKEVKIFGNDGKSLGSYDIIDTIEYVELPGNVRLPVGIRTVRYLAYERVEAERTPAQAEALAYDRLRYRMEGEVPCGTLVRKELTADLSEESFVLRCTANFIEDIAVTREIEIVGLPNGKKKS